MFSRNILTALRHWASKTDRKPLVIRGARQVGKTTVVNQFSKEFDQYLYFNLELLENRRPFESFTTVETLVRSLFFLQNKQYDPSKRILIFIDEIQEVVEAFNILRYFYEEAKNLYVIAAGSLLESLFKKNLSFPVGRVEYLVLRPVSFQEFLGAIGEPQAADVLLQVPLPKFAEDKLFQLFHLYALIGGMPAIVQSYAEKRDLVGLNTIYESLLVSYFDDAEKYASSNAQVQYLRHIIKAAPFEAGKRIKLHGFGKSNYGAREMGEGLRALEKAFLLQLVYPQSSSQLPLQADLGRSPRLQFLDSGLMNYQLGIQKEIVGTKDLGSVYQGTLMEHLVGQELLASKYNVFNELHFWVRDKPTSSAEIDFIYAFDGLLIPIEVKSGKAGKLKSLHTFMDLAPHNLAVRIFGGTLAVNKVETPKGKEFYLMDLPYFLVSQLDVYLKWLLDLSQHGFAENFLS